jgi:hypothetical protein
LIELLKFTCVYRQLQQWHAGIMSNKVFFPLIKVIYLSHCCSANF